MAKKQAVLSVVIFCVVIIIGIWYFLWGRFANMPGSTGREYNNGTTTKDTNIPPQTSVTLPPLPPNYATFIDKAPDMRQEFRDASKKKFAETLETIREHPDSLWAWIDLGSIKKSFNDFTGAEEAWLFATKLYPSHSAAYADLGQLYWHNIVNNQKAEAMFLKVIELDITAVATYRDLADLYRYQYVAKKDQVDNIILRGLKDNPENPDLLSYLALYYYEVDDRENAIKMYEQLVKVAPSNKTAQEDLEDLKAGRLIGSPN